MGYPGEVSKPLYADHHGVCKFDSPDDNNYKSLRSVLQSLVISYRGERDKSIQDETAIEYALVEKFLYAAHAATDRDLHYFLSRRSSHTCSWILKNTEYQRWVQTPTEPAVMWLHGKPGRGKSVLTAHVADHLIKKGCAVQYFFFRYGEQAKRSLGSLLKSLALQLSCVFPEFRKALVRLSNSQLNFRESDWSLIWERIFKSTLFPMDLMKPMYWMIDGLDESDSSKDLMELLSTIHSSATPIRVLLVSRWTPALFASFEKLKVNVTVSVICAEDSSEDITLYTEEEVAYLPWSSELKSEVVQRVADQANGNFLWVHLALEQIKNSHTYSKVKSALNDLPDGMENMYNRMAASISKSKRDSDTARLQRFLFIWSIYSRTPLTIEELCQALEPEWSLLNLKFTASQLCGHFLVIEDNRHVALIHETAREYLRFKSPFTDLLDASHAHYDMFEKCLTVFMDPRLPSNLDDSQNSSFSLLYRATSWAYHLSHVSFSSHSDMALSTIVKFFSGSSVLLWIRTLGCLDKLGAMIETSRRLSSFIQGIRKMNSAVDISQYHRLPDLDFLQLWARDLLKIVAKFGSNLLRHPAAIQDCIIPFCPPSSAVAKTFQGTIHSSLHVQGLSDGWDDCLARVSVGSEDQASMLTSRGRYLAVLNTTGTIILWDCITFEELRQLKHGEYAHTICFSEGGDWIASYGALTTKVWDTATGEVRTSAQSIPSAVALALAFTENDDRLLMSSDGNGIFEMSLEKDKSMWSLRGSLLLDESYNNMDGTYMNSPTMTSFSHDGARVLATYRRFPLTIWSLSPMRLLKKITREQSNNHPVSSQPFGIQAQWHPNNQEILGIFHDGCIFKCGVTNNYQHELKPEPGKIPSKVQCCPDGRIFATSDLSGTIKLYDYGTFTQLYQLASEDVVAEICFGSDATRFYDIRGNYCNVWEPNILVRLGESDVTNDSQSDSGSIAQSNIHSEAFADMTASVTGLCTIKKGSIVCTGNDEGLVEIHNYATGERQVLDQSPSQIPVEHLNWSEDCKIFSYADIVGKIHIFSSSAVPTDEINSLPQCQVIGRVKPQRETGGITQVVLSPDGARVLVGSSGVAHLWSTQKLSLLASHSNHTSSHRWIVHPSLGDHVLSVTATVITVHRWQDLTETGRWSISATADDELDRCEGIIDAQLAHSNVHLILTFSSDIKGRSTSRFAIVHLGSLLANRTSIIGTVKQIRLPGELLDQIERPLNILMSDRLVFVDRSLWVCSWAMSSGDDSSSIKHKFFIPRDWITLGSLSLLHLTESGTILCPRRGDLAIIKTSLDTEW